MIKSFSHNTPIGKVLILLIVILWMASIVYTCYVPSQSEFSKILVGLVIAFVTYALIYRWSSSSQQIIALLSISILCRLLILFAFPNLSDDIYRFLWDGEMWRQGIHPFSMVPIDYTGELDADMQRLLGQMNSPDRHTIYPLIPQLTFWLARSDIFSIQSSAVLLKLIHLLFDVGSLRLIWLLLKRYHLPERRILLYAFNPLIIIETIHNLHHEGIMIFFVLLMLWAITHETSSTKWVCLAGVAMACAISTKLLPLMLCPLMVWQLSSSRRIICTIAVVIGVMALFIPLVSSTDLLYNLMESTDLYIRKFEFNASVYYLLRGMGYVVIGYNLIHILGPILWLIASGMILWVAWRHRQFINTPSTLITSMMLTYMIYLICSATVHPWYVSLLIPLCVFTKFRFPIWWSGLIMCTYVNYSYPAYHENLWVVAIEYILVFAMAWREGFFKLPTKLSKQIIATS